MTPHPSHSQDAKTNPKSLTINITILRKRESTATLDPVLQHWLRSHAFISPRQASIKCHYFKPPSSVTASSLSVMPSSIMRHRVKPLSAVISHRRGTAPSLANQPPKLTAVLATHHHNTLPLPANTPQNLLKTSSHSVQKLRKDDDFYLICYLAGCHPAM
ncbi:hypothetical protein CUMW_233520 [Citrus unshiu]|uniref:Uncharacterized protein n=1 Tax=Citrus unshiu TaxID=55188 RepID=A0A2H5QIH6_CITUN|nr:hypothetical protein CUMW_233520 [Citrus unshiu]